MTFLSPCNRVFAAPVFCFFKNVLCYAFTFYFIYFLLFWLRLINSLPNCFFLIFGIRFGSKILPSFGTDAINFFILGYHDSRVVKPAASEQATSGSIPPFQEKASTDNYPKLNSRRRHADVLRRVVDAEQGRALHGRTDGGLGRLAAVVGRVAAGDQMAAGPAVEVELQDGLDVVQKVCRHVGGFHARPGDNVIKMNYCGTVVRAADLMLKVLGSNLGLVSLLQLFTAIL